MMKVYAFRFSYLVAFTIVGILLGSADYLQYYRGIIPCPLCILQRFALAALGFSFLYGMLVSSKTWGRITTALLTFLFSMLGILLAGRQVWLQYFPPKSDESCEVSLQYLLSVLPIDQVATKIFAGTTNCSRVGWSFLHISLAQWSLIVFILFLFFSFWQLRHR